MPKSAAHMTRRDLLKVTAMVAAGALLLDVTVLDRHHLSVLEHTIRIPRLPAAFYGFRFVQISDFHYHEYDEDSFLRKAVARVNALRPDMVALTGDFITAHGIANPANRRHAFGCAAILREIACPLRFCSLGNHDSIDNPAVIDALQGAGLTVLHNRFDAIDLRGDRLWISGIADAYFDAPDLSRAVPDQRGGSPVILLGHEPDIAPRIAEYGGVDLMLAGHTHGGQVRLPILPPMFLPDMGRNYIHGLFQVNGLQMYVNRGLGTVHLPVRFRCPPEITVLTLEPA